MDGTGRREQELDRCRATTFNVSEGIKTINRREVGVVKTNDSKCYVIVYSMSEV
jgi:hypothetical protein